MLIQISDLEIYLQKSITGGTDEDKYTFLITAVQDLADSICNRTLEETTYTGEVYDGTGTDELYLNNYPVVSVSEVKYGWIWDGSSRSTMASTDYLLDSDIGRLTFGFNSVKKNQMFEISYIAGYSSDPSNETTPWDLKKILMDEIENQMNKTFTSSEIKSETLGDYSYQKFSPTEIENVSESIFAQKLRPYIKADI